MKVAGFGEILLRLATKKGSLLSNAKEFNINYGGGEANVLISLSKFGLESRLITRISDDQIGDAIINYLNEMSVETKFITRTNERTPIYFLEFGSGNRNSKVVYDRKNSSLASINENDIDIEEALKDVDIFHFSGITLAISESVRNLALKIVKYCNKNNVLVSYDSNYRAKMWSLEEAREATLKVLPYINIFSAGILDAENILNMSCELSDKYKKLEYYYGEITKHYPNIQHLFSSIREVFSTSRNSLQCNYYTNDRLYSSNIYNIEDIVDRVGGGDALTAGVIYGIISKKPPEYTCEFGVVASVLKHSIYGDANLVTIEDVDNFIRSGISLICR